MDLNYNLLNIIILFGAIQGYILCFYIYQKKSANKVSAFMFILFLFSLAFLNMVYAFIDLDLFKYYRPLHLFPFPYKWLIGVGLYFYIKEQFPSPDQQPFYKREWFLFLPAAVYGLLKLYWFSISVGENSYRITRVVIDSNFYRIQEIVYLLFNIILGVLLLIYIKNHKVKINKTGKTQEVLRWLNTITVLFIILNTLNIILFIVDLIIHDGQETFTFLYPSLIINAAFIYWIGYIGFTNQKVLFNVFKKEDLQADIYRTNNIKERLRIIIEEQEIYKNPNLTLNELALKLNISPKELSNYINNAYNMNFSVFLNFYRIEKVKTLLTSPKAMKYTLVSLAEEAGFNSKSSFNATFKKMVGVTPSEFRNRHMTN